MSTTMRRKCWRWTALALIGGGAAAAWCGMDRFARAEQPPAPFPIKETPAVWSRSVSAPVESQGGVVPASASIPAPTVHSPLVPHGTKVIVTVPVQVVPSEQEFRPVSVPAIPEVPAIPQPPAIPKVEIPTIPASPLPLTPPPVQPAPPAPPVKSVDPVKPVIPTVPDFNLRPADNGNSVKPEVPVLRPVPTAPEIAPQIPALTGSRPKPPEFPTTPTEKYIYPVPTAPQAITRPIPTPGDIPMNITSRQSALAAVTGFALAIAPTTSLRADDKDKNDPVQLRKDLDAANKRLEDAEKEIKRLTALIDGKKDDKGFRLESDPGAVEEIKRLKDKVKSLEAQVDAMSKSTSLRPPIPAPAAKGTIRVVNEYPVQISIIINDKSYRVEPGTTMSVEVPAGEFSYQLPQSGVGAAPTRSAIKEKEVVTLRVK